MYDSRCIKDFGFFDGEVKAAHTYDAAARVVVNLQIFRPTKRTIVVTTMALPRKQTLLTMNLKRMVFVKLEMFVLLFTRERSQLRGRGNLWVKGTRCVSPSG